MDDKNVGNEENDEATPIPTEALGSSITRIDPSDQSAGAAKLMAERVKSWKAQLPLALQLVSPGQFVVMSQTTKDGEVKETIYATGGAADRVLRVGFGMRWGEKTVTLEHDEDGEPICEVTAPLYTQGGQVYEVFTGRRRMGGYIHNQGDLIKGAIENMKHQAVTDLLGLRFLTPDDLKEAGLDVSKLPRRADFQDRGGDDVGGMKVPWGKKQGTPLSELDDRDLEYYAGKARESLADPAKKKFHAKEQRWLDAIEAEKKRRSEPPPPKVELPAAAEKVKQLLDAAGITDKAARAAVVKTATGKTSAKDVTDEDVAKIGAHLAQLAAQKANAGTPEPGAEG